MSRVPFRVRFPRDVENRLERVPLEVALRLEAHLSAVAELAAANWNAKSSSGDFLEPVRRFAAGGFTIDFEVDCVKQVVFVRGLCRTSPDQSLVSAAAV